MNKATKLLMLGAVSLPALSEAATAPTEKSLDYKYTNYAEMDIAEDVELLLGDKSRYTIDVHQVRFVTPVNDETSIALTSVTESMSGASPWGTAQGQNGDPALIMSGASIQEDRSDLSLAISRYLSHRSWNILLGSSQENDYSSIYLSNSHEWTFNKKNTALALGGSISLDFIHPSDAEEYNRVVSENKNTTSVFLAISQNLTPKTVVQLGASYTLNQGFLSDAYKLNDRRPNTKQAASTNVQLRQYVASVNAAMHIDYRYYADSWEVQSHTVETSWVQNLGERTKITPTARYYFQTEASFYEPYEVQDNPQEFISSDYRLSPYGALSFGVKLEQYWGDFSYNLSTIYYQSDATYSPQVVLMESPGLVSFHSTSVGFSYKW